MSRTPSELDDLLIRRATEGLDEAEAHRLNALLDAHPEVDSEWVDLLLGELDAALLEGEEDSLSTDLRAQLLAAAPDAAAATKGAPAPETPDRGPDPADAEPAHDDGRSRPWLAWSGWAAAAAVAALWWLPSGETPPAPAAPLDFPAVAALSDAVVAQWAPGGDTTGEEASGEVVWSTLRQAGVMRLRGLAVNDPGQFQYQLWIFDRDRDERYPVDGGVFDVPAGATEAEVIINAKLHVDDPTLFAVTVEPPGGVVVSSRERIATIAQISD